MPNCGAGVMRSALDAHNVGNALKHVDLLNQYREVPPARRTVDQSIEFTTDCVVCVSVCLCVCLCVSLSARDPWFLVSSRVVVHFIV